jgi:hypothetical protein
MESITEAFESDDKLRPLASLSSILYTKKEEFLVKEQFGNRSKSVEVVLTLASLLVPILIAILQLIIPGGK